MIITCNWLPTVIGMRWATASTKHNDAFGRVETMLSVNGYKPLDPLNQKIVSLEMLMRSSAQDHKSSFLKSEELYSVCCMGGHMETLTSANGHHRLRVQMETLT